MAKKINPKQHSFTPGARSIIQMGEELIGHPSTAINELVKNAYDADAQNCKVYFHVAIKVEQSFGIIYDNGSGMDDKTLFGDWLKPSISSKRVPGSKSEKYNRYLLGSKGIGRLASMALSQSVTVITKKKKDSPFYWITVNRESFKEDTLLSEVKFPGDEIHDPLLLYSEEEYLRIRRCNFNSTISKVLRNENLTRFSKGTLIILEHLDESVIKILSEDFNRIEQPEDQFDSLSRIRFYNSLATLITPITLNEAIQDELSKKDIVTNKLEISSVKSEFQIDFASNLLNYGETKKIEWIKVSPIPIQNVFDYRLFGKVTKDGDVQGSLIYNRLENKSYEEHFNISWNEIQEAQKKESTLFDELEKCQSGEYYFDIRVYDIGEKDNREKLARKSGYASLAKFNRDFKRFQGLRISKNGFGVKPYGEEVEDWIGLSKERVQNPGQNVNTNQILGYVFFYSPENDSLEEKTNREGFTENTAFLQVKQTLSIIFKNLGRKRYNYRLIHGIGRVPASKHSRPDIDEFYKGLKELNTDPKVINYSTKFINEISTSLDNLEASLSFAERLASLGIGMELVYHEMAQPISLLKTTESSLNLKKMKIDVNERDNFIADLNSLHSASDILFELRESLKPAIGRSRKKKFFLSMTFKKVCYLYASNFHQSQIDVKISDNIIDYELHDLEYAFWISFLNIVNNAVYWIKKSQKPGKISLRLEDDKIVISNTGPQINQQVIDHIFDYGVTTRTEKNATGLGLAFTQSILSRNKWNIRAENRKSGPSFIIEKQDNE